MEKIEVDVMPLLAITTAALLGFIQNVKEDQQSLIAILSASYILPSVLLTIKPLVEIGAQDAKKLGDANESLLKVCLLLDEAVDTARAAGIEVPFDSTFTKTIH